MLSEHPARDNGKVQTDAAGDYMRQRQADGAACLQAALDYLRRGWPVLPLCPPDHAGVSKHAKTCENPGKRPLVNWKEYQDRLPTEAEVRGWWDKWPTANVGVALGPLPGFIRLDIDGPGGERLLAEKSRGDMPLTWEFTSGRENAGRGPLFGIPAGVEFKTTTEVPDPTEELRFQAKGAQTVLPPSRHKSGELYQWRPGHSPDEIALAVAPLWMVEEWRATSDAGRKRRQTEDRGDGEPLEEGHRDSRLTSLAGTMRRRGMTRDEILGALLVVNANRCRPPFDEDVVEKIAASVAGYEPSDTVLIGIGQTGRMPKDKEPTKNGQIHNSELGNALRMVNLFGDDFRHCHPWKKDLVWTGRYWAEDDTAQVDRWAKDTVQIIWAQAAAATDETEKKALGSHAIKSEEARKIRAMIALARSEAEVTILPADMDRDPWLLNVANGTLDLRTGRLRDHQREDFATKLCHVFYEPAATCPLWLALLETVFASRARLIRYVQKLLGHCLTGDVSEQFLGVWWGTGANGKSTIINTILDLLGDDYAIKAGRDLFMAHKGDSHPTQLARLFGKRLVVAVETAESARLDEGLVKELTGSDPVTARRMREDAWQFNPTHKCILVTNHKPEIRGQDEGIWRRIRLTPFSVRIPDNEQDKQLPEKLRTELPGILAWCVTGCRLWQDEGLSPPAEVMDATRSYRTSQDVLALFIEECCEVFPLRPELTTSASELYAAYKGWADRAGEEVMSQRRFGEALSDAGYEKMTSNGVRYRRIRLRQPENKDNRSRE